jgi:hypothetical protein
MKKKYSTSPRNLHWQVNDDQWEYIKRKCFDLGKKYSQMEQSYWFTWGWQQRLEGLRQSQKDLAKNLFIHPKLRPIK